MTDPDDRQPFPTNELSAVRVEIGAEASEPGPDMTEGYWFAVAERLLATHDAAEAELAAARTAVNEWAEARIPEGRLLDCLKLRAAEDKLLDWLAGSTEPAKTSP